METQHNLDNQKCLIPPNVVSSVSFFGYDFFFVPRSFFKKEKTWSLVKNTTCLSKELKRNIPKFIPLPGGTT